MRLYILPRLLGLLCWAALCHLSYGENASEAKLRETLRNTMLQLRTAQNERATLQASQAASEEKVKTLTAQVDKLTKEVNVSSKLATEQEAQLAKYKEALDRWEAAYQQAVDLANAKEAARSKLANDVILLQRRVADQQTKNAAMFRTANEILTRYERFGLGEALAAKEPFVGIHRVKLENLVQDYEDKLAEQKIRPADEQPGATAPSKQSASKQPPKSKP